MTHERSFHSSVNKNRLGTYLGSSQERSPAGALIPCQPRRAAKFWAWSRES